MRAFVQKPLGFGKPANYEAAGYYSAIARLQSQLWLPTMIETILAPGIHHSNLSVSLEVQTKMLNDVLIFLKNTLNTYLGLGINTNEVLEDPVVFLEGNNTDALAPKLGKVSVILVNLEQENILRPPDLYARTLPSGSTQKVQPEIRLNLYVLFLANYPSYEDSLRNLSAVIQYFQTHRLFTHHEAPELSENIERLIVELVTLSFAEQNEVWNALRICYLPSVLYRIKMVVFENTSFQTMPKITEKDIQVS